MSERIKQLAELAWTIVSDEERARGELYEADKQRERRDEVFAEMIVRECARLVEDSKWNLPRGCTAADQAKYVKETFRS